jgi:hypothetical protein
MDEIFRGSSSIFVFSDPKLTQRARPQAFIEAERLRIEGSSDTDDAVGQGVERCLVQV